MNINKLKEAIEIVKADLGSSLLATDIFTISEGLSIAGYNENPAACALFNEVTISMMKSLDGAKFPGLNQYYLLNLQGGHLVLVLYLIDYQWGFLIDSNKVKLGLLLSIVIPKAKEAFIDALES